MRCMKGGFTVMGWWTGSVRPFVFEESTRFAHGEPNLGKWVFMIYSYVPGSLLTSPDLSVWPLVHHYVR
jgi:hypothetical protein